MTNEVLTNMLFQMFSGKGRTGENLKKHVYSIFEVLR